MNKVFQRELTGRFQQEVGRQLPQFVEATREQGKGDSPMWVWIVHPQLSIFIYLQFYEADDIFNIEIGWSDDGVFPWQNGTSQKASPYPLDLTVSKCRSRLARLQNFHNPSFVWVVAPTLSMQDMLSRKAAIKRGEKISLRPKPEEFLPRIDPLVLDAVRKLKESNSLFESIILAHPFKKN